MEPEATVISPGAREDLLRQSKDKDHYQCVESIQETKTVFASQSAQPQELDQQPSAPGTKAPYVTSNVKYTYVLRPAVADLASVRRICGVAAPVLLAHPAVAYGFPVKCAHYVATRPMAYAPNCLR
ncbi:unnamed protein product [Cladocopium goreaui]|uniref:Uncharacterized protein n=1 Tax=Cladocopium goreaui TaxID=2562237 RepID=A0A9P1DUF3_9DINO|nr:unnamed protein product [Cladocopium goreaui]